MKKGGITLFILAMLSTLSLPVLAEEGVERSWYDSMNPKLSGYVMLDYDYFDSVFLEHDNNSGSEAEIRRARLSLKIKPYEDIKSKIQLAAEGNGLEIKDAYLQWTGWQFADLTLGNQKEPFGFEKMMGSRQLSLNERSLSTEAFAPGRSLGVMLSGDFGAKSQLNWQLGLFQPDNVDDMKAVSGRMTWAPWQSKHSTLHFGAAFSERDYQGEEYRLNETLEVHTADTLIESDRLYADRVSLQGIEFLWQFHGLSTLAEWQQSSVETVENQRYDYEGGYLQLSYLLSGQKRRYKKGLLSGIPTDQDWEFTSRWSELDLKEEDDHVRALSLGVNSYIATNFKIMLTYIMAEYEQADEVEKDGQALSLRFQYQF